MRRLAIGASLVTALAGSSVALAASAPSGTYRTIITSTALGGEVKGTWTVTFSRGVFTAAKNGTVATHGNYSVNGSKITIRAAPGQGRCATTSVYTFQTSGTRLKLRLVSGASSSPVCEARQIVLAGSFTKVG